MKKLFQNTNILGVGFIFAASMFVFTSCGQNLQDMSNLRGQSGDFEDDDLSAPSNVSGSFMDFECLNVKGNVACIARHDGYSVPLGDMRLFGSTPPKLVGYLVEDITSGNLSNFETKTAINVNSKVNDASKWGFSLDFSDSSSALTVGLFAESNKSNPNMGIVLTIDGSIYSPEGVTANRKYAVLDKCLFGYYLDEWANPDPLYADVTVSEIPSDGMTAILGGSFLDLMYDQTCKDKMTALVSSDGGSGPMKNFSEELTKIIIDYFLTKNIGDDIFSEVVSANPNAQKLDLTVTKEETPAEVTE